MVGITEDCVSFEVAKLLKEKGFDEITFTWYNGKGKFCVGKNNFDDYHMNHFSNMATAKDKNKCSAPTLQIAMKWLREVHNLFIEMHIQNNGSYIGYIYNTNGFALVGWDKRRVSNSYEEAVEAAIKYCLENLI